MKSYTNIEQSKRLSEILPIESADMFYRNNGIDVKLMWEHNAHNVKYPCWSLAALLEVIRAKVGCDLSIWDEGYNIDVYDLECGKVIAELYSNPVDAVVETIYKLKEKDLL